IRGDLPFQGPVEDGIGRVGRDIDHRPYPELRQVFYEFEPTLDPGSPGGGPIVRYDQDLSHQGALVFFWYSPKASPPIRARPRSRLEARAIRLPVRTTSGTKRNTISCSPAGT